MAFGAFGNPGGLVGAGGVNIQSGPDLQDIQTEVCPPSSIEIIPIAQY